MDIMTSYCLRCNSSKVNLQGIYGECLTCKAHFSIRKLWCYISDFIQPYDQLTWFFGLKQCTYQRNKNIETYDIVDLPFLSMNITPEQLKRYLVFI